MKNRPLSPPGRKASPSRPCSPPERTIPLMSRNGRSTSFPSRTIRIRPACSTMNSAVGSYGRHAMSTGSCSPETNGSIERRGGVSPVGPPLAAALGPALDGVALEGTADPSAGADADVDVAGEVVGDGVGLLQPTRPART